MKQYVIPSKVNYIQNVLVELPPQQRTITFNAKPYAMSFDFYTMVLTKVIGTGNGYMRLDYPLVFGSEKPFEQSEFVHPFSFPHVGPTNMKFCREDVMVFNSPVDCGLHELESFLCSDNKFYMLDNFREDRDTELHNPELKKQISSRSSTLINFNPIGQDAINQISLLRSSIFDARYKVDGLLGLTPQSLLDITKAVFGFSNWNIDENAFLTRSITSIAIVMNDIDVLNYLDKKLKSNDIDVGDNGFKGIVNKNTSDEILEFIFKRTKHKNKLEWMSIIIRQRRYDLFDKYIKDFVFDDIEEIHSLLVINYDKRIRDVLKQKLTSFSGTKE